MTGERESGAGGRESEVDLPPNTKAPTPDSRLPAPDTVNWPLLYAAVLGELVILVVIFYAFTKAFA
jgi:hypothetical protein